MLERAERAASAGDLVSADELLRGAARVQEQELGPHHPDLANTLNNLAIVAERTGRPSDAETFYRRAAAIAAAALPPDHPMTVASRQNLEDFCRARGLPLDGPAVTTVILDSDLETNPFQSEQPEADQSPVRPDNGGVRSKGPRPSSAAPLRVPDRPAATAPAPTPRNDSHVFRWVAAGAVVVVFALLFVLRPWSSREAPSVASTSGPAAVQPVESVRPQAAPPVETVPPQAAPPPTPAAAITQPAPPAAAPARDDRNVPANDASAPGGIAVVTAQLCRTFSTSGRNWRCDAAGDTAAPGRMVFYTRVRTPRTTAVEHRWYQGATLRRSVRLTIQANAAEGYRTYSRMTVDKGDWRLELRSADGSLLHEQRFAVQ